MMTIKYIMYVRTHNETGTYAGEPDRNMEIGTGKD